MKLYELTEAYQNIYQLEELEEEAWVQTLDTLQDEIDKKAVNIAYVIKNLEGDIEVIGKEIKRLQTKKKTAKNKQKRLRRYLQDSMLAIETKKIQTPVFHFKIQKNQSKLNIEEPSKIPDEYFIVKQEIDKEQLKKDLKDGIKIEGAKLIESESLTIR